MDDSISGKEKSPNKTGVDLYTRFHLSKNETSKKRRRETKSRRSEAQKGSPSRS